MSRAGTGEVGGTGGAGWPSLCGMATDASEPLSDGAAVDPHTTAGKLADLDRRRNEAVHAGSERRSSGSTPRAR